MPKVTYTRATVVNFMVEGSPRQDKAGLRCTRDDGGLVQCFLRWQFKVGRFPAFTRATGGGVFYGAFFPEDAEAVEEWLKENGAEEAETEHDDD